MKPYERFAEVYDLMGADRHSEQMCEYSIRIFKRFGIKAVNGLDLCCGTGTAVSLLSDFGITMSGLDGSAEMLTIARRKLKRYKTRLYHQKLPNFNIHETNNTRTMAPFNTKRVCFDLVTCFYDSLNYLLSERALLATFRSVARHLHPGGWFIFDMNTLEALKILWEGQIFADVRDDISWVWKSEYVPAKKIAHLDATFFVKQGRTWSRFDERHTERAYTNVSIKKMLRQAGFVVKGFYHCKTFKSPTRDSMRICGVAQKK